MHAISIPADKVAFPVLLCAIFSLVLECVSRMRHESFHCLLTKSTSGLFVLFKEYLIADLIIERREVLVQDMRFRSCCKGLEAVS